jgi:hypothetical protein
MTSTAQDVYSGFALASHPHVDSPAAHRTRAALLALGDSVHDHSAAVSLWNENRDAIESEMTIHLRTSSDPQLRARILSGLAMQARFFCNELDDPQQWVARCANLESRRAALESKR